MKCWICKHVRPMAALKDQPATDKLNPTPTTIHKAWAAAHGHCHRFPPGPGGYPVVGLEAEGCGEAV